MRARTASGIASPHQLQGLESSLPPLCLGFLISEVGAMSRPPRGVVGRAEEDGVGHSDRAWHSGASVM